jgi:Rrf2 family cysteine metabolism transcriptional repressor
MIKSDLIEEVSRAVEMPWKDSEAIVDAIFDSIVRAVRGGDKVEMRGFGSFRTRQRGALNASHSSLSGDIARDTASMNISRKGEYALLAIFDLAANASPEPVKIADIARRQKIPQNFLEVILVSLKEAGFVESRRGPEGGYLLSKRPESITVGEVLRFVEGWQERRSRLRRMVDSPFAELWDKADQATDSVLDSTSFAQLVRESTEKDNRFVRNWEI